MQRSSPGTYTVQSGDTLQGIARKLWGDASLWYMLADANGISSNDGLGVGVSLSVPTVNNNVHNNSDTFKPYDASKIIGKTEAEPIAPPAPSGCGSMIVSIVVIVVAVIVAWYVAPAIMGAAGTSAATAGASSAGVAAGAGAAGASMGTAATTSMVGNMVAGAAIGGISAAAGNAAGQLTGMALGMQDGFDMASVFRSGAQGALGGAVGAIAGAASNWAFTSDVGRIAVKSAIQAGGNFLTSRLMGSNAAFSWKAMAANVAGSMAGHYSSQNVFGNSEAGLFARDFTSSFAGGAAENLAREMMDIGGKRDWVSVATDAFGNALGNSLAGKHRAEAQAIAARQESIDNGYAVEREAA